jgi:hypothetical protein
VPIRKAFKERADDEICNIDGQPIQWAEFKKKVQNDVARR